MPMLVWLYLIALLYDQTSATCVALPEALGIVSHDHLTRLLRAYGAGQTFLEHACPTRVVWEPGDLILDDTVIPKPSATPMDPGTGLLQPGAPTCIRLVAGPAGLVRSNPPDALAPSPLAQGGLHPFGNL
jgi:hypothetical protein